jgi:hypothetical protein
MAIAEPEAPPHLGADVGRRLVRVWRSLPVITGLVPVIPMMKSAALQTIEMAVPGSSPRTARDNAAGAARQFIQPIG